jgi:hypothetical protein
MPSVIEAASTGRAKCRTCGQGIAKGDYRFGDALPNAYGEGESLFWFHLGCAACSRPESFLPVLEKSSVGGADLELLETLAKDGIAHERLSRLVKAERASSGRARCRYCRELIEQGSLRIALHFFEEGRFNPSGTIHAACAVHYFEAEPARERFLLPGNALGDAELDEVIAELREGAQREIKPGVVEAPAEET